MQPTRTRPGSFLRFGGAFCRAAGASCLVALGLGSGALAVSAQRGGGDTLGEGPWTYQTFERGTRIEVSVVTKGLSHPWSLAFLPDGAILITERDRAAVRLVRDSVLDPDPVDGISGLAIDKLFDIALHPDYAENGLVYLTYMKDGARPDGSDLYWATTALARGRFDGQTLAEVEEIFEADAWQPLVGGDGSRVAFGPDGTLYLSSSHRRNPDLPQDLGSDVGKILRLRDDGTIPDDNPFVGQAGHKPEIFSYGHRTVLGLTFHPETGELWETENGPQGGDEVNIIRPGRNYGWPLVSYGRDYDGTRVSDVPWMEEMEQPELFWVPSVTASGIQFYDGDAFPAWQGNLFLGALTEGRIPRTGSLQRVVFNQNGEQRRETLLQDLGQRIRDVRQGPDGLLYLLTEENVAALLKIEPASQQ